MSREGGKYTEGMDTIDLLRMVRERALSSYFEGHRLVWLQVGSRARNMIISLSFVKSLKENGSLGACFFFRSVQGDPGNAAELFPSIARQLTAHIPELMTEVREYSLNILIFGQ